ncbi:heme-binding protein 2 [Megalops cyprinoides]|uniref:heme-binding protein 2 n=1 Tax=Megalops cyprinoides TaxID=118141 RepID=UPI00186434FF|nr:heme-binding protein 2 [Megalops cyprinoides]
MACVSGILLLVLMVTAEAYVGNSSESSFCTETKECLLFDLVCKTPEYEVRHYSLTRWVSTEAESYFMEIAVTTAFRRLFKYITGANENGQKIDMTAPVLVKMQEDRKLLQSSVYTLSFLLPSAYQANAPKPTDEKVYFTDMADTMVYVRSYGGWMVSMTDRIHSSQLKKDLDRVQAAYGKDFHYAVGYDSPMKLLNRHNEVWYSVEGEPVCTSPDTP